MQQTEHGEKQLSQAPADPESQPLQPVSIAQVNENEDDPEIIFAKAVAEIDTQPLPRRTHITIADILQTVFCISLMSVGLFGIVWQAITYPHTLVVLYAREQPASITATLAIPTRTLAPITITRSATTSTTGRGHQDARTATGTLTFYNGLFTSQTVPIGTVFVANNGVKVATEASITIPASNPTSTPPQLGYASVTVSAVVPGAAGNIAVYAINATFGNGVSVKNTDPFHNGQDARDYKAVAQSDLATLTSTVNQTVAQALTIAFPVRHGEEAIPTTCHSLTTPTHQVGQEAQNVTLTLSKTCSAVAYDSQELDHQATEAFTQTKPARHYHLMGPVQTTVHSITPFSVTIHGMWVYTFSPDYEQLLAEKIAGDTPNQARKALLRTGVIAYASIPTTLPPAIYINFLVLLGK